MRYTDGRLATSTPCASCVCVTQLAPSFRLPPHTHRCGNLSHGKVNEGFAQLHTIHISTCKEAASHKPCQAITHQTPGVQQHKPRTPRTHTTLSLVSSASSSTQSTHMTMPVAQGTALAMCQGALMQPAMANVSTGRSGRRRSRCNGGGVRGRPQAGAWVQQH